MKTLITGLDDRGTVWCAIQEGDEFVLQYCNGWDGFQNRSWTYYCREKHPDADVEMYKSERSVINALKRRCTHELKCSQTATIDTRFKKDSG